MEDIITITEVGILTLVGIPKDSSVFGRVIDKFALPDIDLTRAQTGIGMMAVIQNGTTSLGSLEVIVLLFLDVLMENFRIVVFIGFPITL